MEYVNSQHGERHLFDLARYRADVLAEFRDRACRCFDLLQKIKVSGRVSTPAELLPYGLAVIARAGKNQEIDYEQ